MKDSLGKFLANWRIKAVLPDVKGRLLDIGCGMNELVRQYDNGIGIDVYQWGSVDLVLEDTAQIPVSDESFDTISIIATLNHIPNREEVLKEAHRILKPKGRIIITMLPPFISRIWHFIRKPWDVDQKERGMKKGEIFGLTNKEINKLLTKAGFKIKKKKKFMFFINTITIGEKA